jgi:hypothetical protein|tara:strand:+ start:4420 stop:4680 length:261 start_codon:yes stop_codon:yes gene_type:complete
MGMATPKPVGFDTLLSATDTIELKTYNSGGPHWIASLRGQLLSQAGVITRARGRDRTMGGALQALWRSIDGQRLVEEIPEAGETST